MTTSYDICVYIVYDHCATDQEKTLLRPCGDRTETVQSLCSHCVIFTTSSQKSHDAHAIPLRVPNDYLKSLRSFFCPNDYLNLEFPSRSACCARTRGSCNLPAMCLVIFHSLELNKIVEATMCVNLYDDCTVSLQRPHGKGDLDIIRAS